MLDITLNHTHLLSESNHTKASKEDSALHCETRKCLCLVRYHATIVTLEDGGRQADIFDSCELEHVAHANHSQPSELQIRLPHDVSQTIVDATHHRAPNHRQLITKKNPLAFEQGLRLCQLDDRQWLQR